MATDGRGVRLIAAGKRRLSASAATLALSASPAAGSSAAAGEAASSRVPTVGASARPIHHDKLIVAI